MDKGTNLTADLRCIQCLVNYMTLDTPTTSCPSYTMRTCALRDLSLPALPGAPPGSVAPHRVARDAAVVAELASDLHGAVDRLLGLTALRVT